jgi:hypothetical protein
MIGQFHCGLITSDFSLVQPAGAYRLYSLAPDQFEDLWR